MPAPVLAVDAVRPEPEVVARAARVIRDGGLVAIPTETVYGLAANALDAGAVRRIFASKGRPAFNPVIVHIADAADLPHVARDIPPVAGELAARFWPGPLTLVLRRQPAVPDVVTAGLDTVGVRVPSHPVMRAVIRAAGVPLAAPSANLFTRVSPTTAAHVAAQLGDRLDLILDAGPTMVGIESTVVDLTSTPPRLLRPGGVPRDVLEKLLGPLGRPPAGDGTDARPSPGMIARHYAPHTTLRLFPARSRERVLTSAAELSGGGQRVAVVLIGGVEAVLPFVRRMPADPERYARDLYAMLHGLEDEACEVAFIEEPPDAPAWDAVRDRLKRAATPAD
jgi:L-threonylcarbamoyladenylate synthase